MNPTTSEIAGLFWSQCWQLTALIVVVGLLGATICRQRPHLLHLLWVIVFVKSLTLPLWSSPTSVFSWLEPRRSVAIVDHGYLTPAPSPFAANPSRFAANPSRFSSNRATFSASQEGQLSTPARLQVSEPIGRLFSTQNLIAIAFGIWAVGVVVLLALAMRRWIEVYRLLMNNSRAADPELDHYARQLSKRLKMTSRVRVLVSESNLGPLVFGSYRPVLILPAALTTAKSPGQLQPILAHELLHARRGDTTFGALQFVSQVVWWFHPLVWWASRQANRLSERCCDEEVIANLGCKPREYAHCLLDALELRASLSTAPGLPGIRSVDITSHRVESIMNNANRFRRTTPRHYWVYAVIVALLVLPGGGLLVQAWEGPESATPANNAQSLGVQAQQAATNKQWGVAAAKYRALTERDDADGRAWFMLGYSLHANGEMEQAIVAHKRASTFPRAKATALYNLACAYALTNESELAIDTLERAVDAGFISLTPIGEDSDFASLKHEPEFLKLAKASKPHAQREVYRQFDFWVGRWDVYDRDGQIIGTNIITKDEKGYLLTEKWTHRSGDTGTSINYYDPSDRQWKQTCVDADGNVMQYCGGFAEGKMSLEGRLTKPNGVVVGSRVSYSLNKDGSVRQLIEFSDNAGQTWRTYFDGKYVRHEDGAIDEQAGTASIGMQVRPSPS